VRACFSAVAKSRHAQALWYACRVRVNRLLLRALADMRASLVLLAI